LKVRYERHPIGTRINVGNQELMLCGVTPNGQPHFSRRWGKDVEEYTEAFHNTTHMYAPTVMQLRKRQGELHDLHAERGVVELYDKHEGASIVVVGNGPSIVKALPVIKELREKHGHIVIGTNACMQYGYRNVMDYYMVLCWLTQNWWWHGQDVKNVPCITSFHSTAAVIRDFPIRYYFNDSFLDVTVLKPETRNRFGCLDGGMTVVYSAMHMAFKMGAARIVFAGMDLAYTDYMDHPNDPLDYGKAISRKVFVARDIRGNATLSDERMVAQKELIKGQTIFVEEAGVEVVNITDAGILDIGFCESPEGYLNDVRAGVKYERIGGQKYVELQGPVPACSAAAG